MTQLERFGEESDDDYEDIDVQEVSDHEDIIDDEGEDYDFGEDMEGVDDDEEDSDEEKDEGDGDYATLQGGELDLSVYNLFRAFKLPYPCLSVDSFDENDPKQSQSPYSVTLVAGSQAERDQEHRLYLLKSKLLAKKIKKEKPKKGDADDDDSDDSSSSDSESEAEAEVDTEENRSGEEKEKDKNSFHCIGLKHNGICNRVRQNKVLCSNGRNINFVASWSSIGAIHVYDVTDTLLKLNPTNTKTIETDITTLPVLTYKKHNGEGYGLDWCKMNPLKLASGNCSGELHVWQLDGNGTKIADNHTFSRSKASIEDIQWSPAEETVLSTCSTDSSVKIWDCRTLSRCMISVDRAHKSDVNVISWNPHGDPFIVSGGDDHTLNVWDLRQMSSSGGSCVPVATFEFHQAPITSVQWNPSPSESTQFMAASDDKTVSVWDLSLEKEKIADGSSAEMEEESASIFKARLKENACNSQSNKKQKKNKQNDEIPAQLLFLHEGQQTHIKEVTWHASVRNMIVSTSLDGFQAFIPSNL